MRIVDRFIALNCELFRLIEEIQESYHADAPVDRGEPSLRVA